MRERRHLSVTDDIEQLDISRLLSKFVRDGADRRFATILLKRQQTMQTGSNQLKQLPTRGLKQVKVDNWGTFFLQRLQQLYFDEELLDLTIKFPTSDITVQAHRLVITTCTDYFTQLERQQKEKDEHYDGILVMPPDMPYECVKSIISFMYTGTLEYWTSEQNALYRTAQNMNMTVLTKLLDAQFNTSALQTTSPAKSKPNPQPVITSGKPVVTSRKILTGSSQISVLSSQPLPGRKLPIWKRKLDSGPSNPLPSYDMGTYHSKSSSTKSVTSNPGPSRFDLPEVEDFALGVFSSFDDITYNTKPIVKAPTSYGDSNNTDNRGTKRQRDDIEQFKHDSTEDEDDDYQSKEPDGVGDNSDDDWSGPKSILRPQETQSSPSKRVRFDLEEKENVEKSKSTTSPPNSADAITNHAKIIREVLKKYPQLVKNNKNIRLKIMQKEAKSPESTSPAKTKVSYVVLKSDHLLGDVANSENVDESKSGGGDGAETGPWKCTKCDLEEEYATYYMYRRHMQDVHEEKFDPRVCEHCGYKATKRNILMYHLYTKHNVPPPKSMSFPKCQACSYVALSENLLVRHQINHKHRPTSRLHPSVSEEFQCLQCSETFSDVVELSTHEINTGHGNGPESTDKTYRCQHCGKQFVRASNLQVHLDCAHKELARNTESEPTEPIPLEPSSEAEALSHVASGIAASLGVGDSISTPDQIIIPTSQTEYIVPEMEIPTSIHSLTYNGQEVGGGGQMVMLIDNTAYQSQEVGEHQQTVHQLNVAVNEQIVMQGDEGGMIVYVHENEEGSQQSYQVTESTDANQETEEIVEEVVEEVEEVEEEVEEVEEVEVEEVEEVEELEEVEETQGEEEETEDVENNERMPVDQPENQRGPEGTIIKAEGNEHQEEEIQYVEEETEILEYQEEQSHEQHNEDHEPLEESVMIVEGENVQQDDSEMTIKESKEQANKKADILADEWDEDSVDTGAS